MITAAARRQQVVGGASACAGIQPLQDRHKIAARATPRTTTEKERTPAGDGKFESGGNGNIAAGKPTSDDTAGGRDTGTAGREAWTHNWHDGPKRAC